ncbi:MAG: leucine-rich repeat domain-containing protein [Muribaculaceae bacterium]|nr:leucine-rich repeat domain-containing protein [Muribaculaceae bacterium]
MSKTPSFLECISFNLVLVILASVLPQRMAARDIYYRYGSHTIIYEVISEEARTCQTKAGVFHENGTITEGNNVAGTVTIPEKIEDSYGYIFTVVGIGECSFSHNTRIKSIKLPKSVKRIGQWAFSTCSQMEEISLPDSLQLIYTGAFAGCNKLKNLEIPFSVIFINSRAFESCYDLTKFIFPNHKLFEDEEDPLYNLIDDITFFNCRNLKEIIIPQSIGRIGNQAFQYCYALTSISIPNSVSFIGRNAFQDCTSLSSVTIGNSVQSFEEGYNGSEVFRGCSKLKEIVSLPTTPPLYSSSAFSGVPSDAVVYIPKGSLSDYSRSWKNFKKFVEIDVPKYSIDQSNLTLEVGETKTISVKKTKVGKNVTEGCRLITIEPESGIITLNLERNDKESEITINGAKPGTGVLEYYLENEYGIKFRDYCYITVIDAGNGVDSIISDDHTDDSSTIYYDLNGRAINPDNVQSGIYIRKCNGETKKIIIR